MVVVGFATAAIAARVLINIAPPGVVCDCATIRERKGGVGRGIQPGHLTCYSGHGQGGGRGQGLVDAALSRERRTSSATWYPLGMMKTAAVW